jgi:general stress protein YciG
VQATPSMDDGAGDGSEPATDPSVRKDPAAVELGRRGGLKGGPARDAALSPERKSEIARKAAAARWANKKKDR